MRCIHCILHFMHISFLLFMRSKLYPCYSPHWRRENVKRTGEKKIPLFPYSLYFICVFFPLKCLAKEWNGIWCTFSCSPCRSFKDDDGSAIAEPLYLYGLSYHFLLPCHREAISRNQRAKSVLNIIWSSHRARDRDSRWMKRKKKEMPRNSPVPKDRTGWCWIKRLLFRSHA